MTKLFYLFLFCLVSMEAQSSIDRPKLRSACPRPELAHGYAKLKQRGRMARFACYAGYELVGDKYATCYGGKWDVPAPICVRGGCIVPKIENALILPTHNNAWLNIFCMPKYTLSSAKSSAKLFCDGRNWNGSIPTCIPDTADEQLSCDFETPDLCGWVQDSRHDFDWTRLNKRTPSAFLFTGPAYDHTYGEGKQGYYMYIESSSKAENDTARLISPVYSGDLEQNGCFSFFYHMYGRSIGGLRVYQIPESQKDQILDENETKNQYLLFEKWGNQGDMWYRGVSYLKDVSDNFQIVIEGVRGTSFTSDIAIDDVALLTGPECSQAFTNAVTPAADIPESCVGRCTEQSTPQRGCGCTSSCIGDGDCCADFLDMCVFNPDLPSTDDDDTTTIKNPSDHPRTEKLIAPISRYTSTTSTTTTTTPKPTTITSRTPTSSPKAITSTTTTKAPPKSTTAKPKPVVTTTTPPTTRMTTVVLTSKIVKITNTTVVTTESTRDARKVTKDIEARKIVKVKEEGSNTAAGVIVLILFVVMCVGAALAARSARGRAALARLRGRATSDPEVRYLTSDHD